VLADRQPGRVNIDFGAMNGAAYMVRITNEVKTDRNLWPTTIDTRRSFYIEGLESGTRSAVVGRLTNNPFLFCFPILFPALNFMSIKINFGSRPQILFYRHHIELETFA